MYPVLNLGPLAIHVPGLILLVGVWFGLWWVDRGAARTAIDRDWLSSTLLMALGGGLIAARIAYAIPAATAYLNDPLALIRPELNSFEPAWGLITAALVVLIRFQRRSLLTVDALAVVTPGVIILFIATALADLAAGSHYGLPTTLPWGIQLWEASRHPTQVYRIIGCIAALLLWERTAHEQTAAARLRLTIGTMAATIIISDGFLADSATFPGGIRISQVLAWVVLVLAWPTTTSGTAVRQADGTAETKPDSAI